MVYNKSQLQDINNCKDKISLIALNASIENPIVQENNFVMPLTDLVFALTELKNAESSLLNDYNSEELKQDIESLDNRIVTLLRDRYKMSLST